MRPVLGLALSLSFLFLSSVPVVGDTWPLLPDVNLLWQNVSNREGNLWDYAASVAVKGDRVFAVGESETTAGSSAFTVKAYDASNGKLLWENYYDREGAGWDGAYKVVVEGDKIFVSGQTETAAGGLAFTVRAYGAKKGKLLWENNYDREGSFQDGAGNVVVVNNTVYAAGQTKTAAGSAFTVMAYNASNGELLYRDYQTPEASKQENWAVGIAIEKNTDTGDKVFVAGTTETTAGGMGFAVRAYKAVATPPPTQPFL